MKYQAILFDLDGTLLPMDNDAFTMGYLNLLSETVAPYGFKKETMIPAMWKGVAAMVKNDGSRLNSEVFWEVFSEILGKETLKQIPRFDTFYENEFHKAISFTQPTKKAAEAVAAARGCSERVILATNPFFPRVAVNSRLTWAGLSSTDFDLITDYDNSTFCKPNPAYYHEILGRFDLSPANCLMVGNNTDEDILAAKKAGLSTFLLADCLIAKGEIPETPKGSFDDLIEFLEQAK